MSVLILGNGISRLAFHDQILAYPGEVWACNYAFRDYPERISKLTGHIAPLEEADALKKERGLNFEIMAGMVVKSERWKRFTVDRKWLRDSGSSLAAQALHDGHDIELVGFDMGGADVYSPNHWEQDKRAWVRRWAEILREWGPDRVTFWGYDHKPYLLEVMKGQSTPDRYWKLYRGNHPHILTESYKKFHRGVSMEQMKRDFEIVVVEYPNGYRTRVNAKLAKILLSKNAVKEIERIKPELEETPVVGSTIELEAPKKRKKKAE